jgi:PKD repeat protein
VCWSSRARPRTCSHTYSQAGTFTAKLTVTDPGGLSASATVQIVVTGTAITDQSPPGDEPKPAPSQAPWFGVSKPAKTSIAKFRKRGLTVQVTCNRAMTGSASIRLSAKLRKQLKLKSATLASGAVKCSNSGTKRVTLKPSKAVRRALKKAQRSLKVKLVVRLRAMGEPARKSTRSLRLTR